LEHVIEICETLIGPSMDDLCRRATASVADLVELRLDGLAQPDVRRLLAACARPAVVTCRPAWEGGGFVGEDEVRARALEEALDAGAAFVDVEWRAAFRDRLLRRAPDRVVASYHDFAGVPANLVETSAAMGASAAAIVKIAVRTSCLRDLLALREVAARLGDRRKVLIGMGPAGLATRILGGSFGSCWSYAGEGAAPGQLPVSTLAVGYRVHDIGPSTAVYALVGRPVGHSVSPAMHNAAFAALGVDAVYVPLEASSMVDFDAVAGPLGIVGVSVTAPFKRDAASRCVGLDGHAAALGTVNTLRRDSRRGPWRGRNTDVDGFLAPLRDTPLGGVRATVIGAGGAAWAVARALTGRGAAVTVRARTVEAACLAAGATGAVPGALPVPPGTWDLLVNATPVGTWPNVDASLMAGEHLDGRIVYDLVYNPAETQLLRDARAAGCRVIGGLDMLVAQAGQQFEWWTGRPAPLEVMRAAAVAQVATLRDGAERT
jgi:3-dehydroquinate dehydratase/shikimate dehydrogenase